MKKILFFDLETSGTDFYENNIIEFGATLYEISDDGCKLITEVDEFVNIGYPIPAEIVKLTHITDEILENQGISEFDLYNIINNMIDEDTILSAYNIQFDINFLMALFRKYYKSDFIFSNPILDVLAVYKDRYYYPHRLKDAILHFDIDIANTHRAIDDIKATVLVLKALSDELPNIEKYINKVGYHQEYGIFGEKLPQVLYILQKGGQKEIEKY